MDTILLRKKKYVLVPEAEFKRLVKTGAPPLPPKNVSGNYPTLAAAEATIARSIIRRRGAVGMTLKQLADAARVRVEVLNRAERGAVIPSVKTLTKIKAALQAAERTKRV